jgi:hypothetical protein
MAIMVAVTDATLLKERTSATMLVKDAIGRRRHHRHHPATIVTVPLALVKIRNAVVQTSVAGGGTIALGPHRRPRHGQGIIVQAVLPPGLALLIGRDVVIHTP